VRRFALILALAANAAGVALTWAQGEMGLDLGAHDELRANIEAGRAIAAGAYSLGPSAACFKCHGMKGEGDAAAVFPRLSGQSYRYLYLSLQDYASGDRENAIMGPIAKAMSDAEMRNVSAYYAVQEPEPDALAGLRSRGDPSLLQYGAALAAVGHAERGIQGCMNCHGPEGSGLFPTYPYLAGQYAAYLEAQLRAWQTGQRRSERVAAAAMAVIAKQMTEEDIRAAALYYASMPPPVDTPAPVSAPGVVSPGVAP